MLTTGKSLQLPSDFLLSLEQHFFIKKYKKMVMNNESYLDRIYSGSVEKS